MNIVDLTHTISPDMPVYPGTEPPIFKIGCSIENDGFLEKEITLFSHTGTHIDAPAHLLDGHKTLDQLRVEHYFGDALLIDYSKNQNKTIDTDYLKKYSEEIADIDFLLINTGWSKFWGTKKYFSGYPVLSAEAANWLSGFNLKGIGFDSISADVAESIDFEIHKTLLKKNIIIIENLKNLSGIGSDLFKFSCFPLKLQEADGSPVRAIAYLD